MFKEIDSRKQDGLEHQKPTVGETPETGDVMIQETESVLLKCSPSFHALAM